MKILRRAKMSEKFDVAKWHQKALEDSRLEGQLFRSVPASSYEELFDRIASLEAEVEALKAERRWIPVSERLPEEGEEVVVAVEGGFVYPDTFDCVSEGILHFYDSCNVTHWMPLPEPPEVEK